MVDIKTKRKSSESAALPLDDPPVLEIFSFSLDETNS